MLRLFGHPLSSYTHKALIALYENDAAFELVTVDFSDPGSRGAFEAVWPRAMMPVLRDEARGETVAEATIVIEYLDEFYPGETRFIPEGPDSAWKVRMWDRFFDNYVHAFMQRLTSERLRPEGAKDSYGEADARAKLRRGYEILEESLPLEPFAMGKAFTLVDCAAAPALFYADLYEPLADKPKLSAYLDRLMARRSYARALAEAEPFFAMAPTDRPARRVRG
jgi:glutathione S-transferase